LYEPLVRAALRHWETVGRVSLALDTSVLKGSPFVLIRVSLIYRGRAIPLAWRVIRHASATVGYADYQPVLDAARSILPVGLEVVLLADRRFVHRQLFCWLRCPFATTFHAFANRTSWGIIDAKQEALCRLKWMTWTV
jgi:hypothetical protein